MLGKQFLKIEIEDGIAVITMDNPPLNLLNIEMMQEIRDAVDELGGDPDMRVIILTGGAGKNFSAGADMTTFKILPKGTNTPFGQGVMSRIEACPLAVIAAINGNCFGGGMELALACDIRIASDQAKIGLVEASLGIIAAYGGQTRLPWLIGEANAKKLFFTAERLAADKAMAYGIVQEVVPHEMLLDKAKELARQIARNAPRSIATAKQITHACREPLFGGSFLQEQRGSAYVGASQDAKEGWAAFKEKRAPQFKNK